MLAVLLASCPRLHLLVTSRAALHLSAEYEFAVPPLSVPDLPQLPASQDLAQVATVALFLERARAIQADFQLTAANAHTVAAICTRLEGLPLAVELAAARIKLLPPQALLSRLEHRLEVLTSGAQDLPARQQTLRNTASGAMTSCVAEEQRLFRRLSVFVGGFSLEAATAVCNSGSDPTLDVPAGVASLLDKSLLLQTEQEGEEPRFRMLETLREFGLERLRANGEEAAARQAYASVLSDPGGRSRAVSGGSRAGAMARPAGMGAREPARCPPTGSDRGRQGGAVRLAPEQYLVPLMDQPLVSERGTQLSGMGPGPEVRLHRLPYG